MNQQKERIPPLCLRFKVGDVERVKEAATFAHLPCSTWVRLVSLETAKLVTKGLEPPTLTFTTAKGFGEQVCVRFTREELTIIRKVAIKQHVAPSTWIRAIVLLRVEKGKKNAAQRKRK